MWIVEIGQIGSLPGEESTRTIATAEEASRRAAECVAAKMLVDRGVSESDAQSIAEMAGYTWCDDQPTLLAVRIYEQ